MRVVIVGTGFMGQIHAEAWKQIGTPVIAFVGTPDGGGEPLAGRHGARFVTGLDEAVFDADVVDICAPTYLHRDFTLRAARAGKHVICEKPLALSVEDGEAMIQACRAAGVRLFVAHVLRFFPEYRLARDIVVRGEIGQPAVLRLSRCAFRPRKADNWFADPARSGGMMLDLMVHDFDYARWVAGDVVRVFAKAGATSGRPDEVDHALAILTHRGGALTHVEGSWAFPPSTFRTHLEIGGSGGQIEFDGPATAAISLQLHGTQNAARQDVPLATSPLHESPFAAQLRAFRDAIERGSEPPVSAEDGVAAVQIARAAIESARLGTPVELGSSIPPKPRSSGDER